MRYYPYVSLGEGLPPAPILSSTLTPPDWADHSTNYTAEAFLGTGSDCTLIPLEIPLEIVSTSQLRLVEINASIKH